MSHEVTLHASCVDFDGRGVLITGPSGAGKSSLALQLMGYGGQLVADDQLRVQCTPEGLIASAPPGLPPLIEARGIGLLRADLCPATRLHLWVELTRRQGQRLPQLCDRALLNHRLELVSAPLSCHLGAAIRQYIRCGRES